MDLDSFTQNLMERTQQRVQNLNKKTSELTKPSARKRHTPLIEDQQILAPENQQNNYIKQQTDDSPKRQCLDAVLNKSETNHSELSNDDEDMPYISEEEKENAPCITEPQNVSCVPFHSDIERRGLAALRKHKINHSELSNDDEDMPYISEEEKKNAPCITEPQNVSYVPFHSDTERRGLAALRKHKILSNVGLEKHSPSKDIKIDTKVVHISSLPQHYNSHSSRFAALAADIQQWEDDTTYISSLKIGGKLLSTEQYPTTNETTVYSLKYSNNNTKETASATNSKPLHSLDTSLLLNINSNVNPKHETSKDNSIKGNSASKSGFGFSAEKSSNSSSLQKTDTKFKTEHNTGSNWNVKSQHIRKVHVWDQAILTTLEAQGFVKSPSTTKLSYKFAKKSEEIPSAKIQPIVEISRKENEKIEKTKEIPTSVVRESTLETSKPNVKHDEKNALEYSSSSSEKSIMNYKDPAELPLSARKALFEKAFCGGGQKQSSEAASGQNMSVAQRAALFEKTAMVINRSLNTTVLPTPKSVVKEPIKFVAAAVSPTKTVHSKVDTTASNSTIQKETKMTSVEFKASPIKSSSSSSQSSDLTSSPIKNVGAHTRLLQQRLTSQSSSDWRNKEIVAKATAERKHEMMTLLNHWEKVSSSSSSLDYSNPEMASVGDQIDESVDAKVKSSNSLQNQNSSVFEEEHDENKLSDDEVVDDDVYEDDDQEFKEENEDLNSDDENEIQYNKCSSEDIKVGDLTGEAVAVCDEMDEILNEALDQEVKNYYEMAPPNQLPPKKPMKSSSSSASGSAYSIQEQITSSKSRPSPSFSNTGFTHVADNDSEVPLLHTVSFYRRQKQEARTTPVRTIVRKEQVMSPPSPEVVDRTTAIQERIKTLHEEVLTQQTVISQTSQALNLCHSTAEFFGSTEQVEGERLLLIATQKRQACLNEIQRLKTQGAQGNSIDDGKGTLTLNDIRLPLKRDFIASELEGKLNDTVHYFLCLIRHGAQVIATQMLSTKDKIKDGLCFTNHITLRNLYSDFSVAFEVYALQTKKEMMPHDKKYHIKKDHSKIRLTPKGKRTESRLLSSPAISSPGGPTAVRTPSFAVVGFTRFTLQNCDRKCFTLEKVPFVSPLEGTVQLKIQVHAEHNIVEKGFLTMFEDVSGFGAWHRRWYVLDGSNLAYWKYPDDEKRKEALGIIDLRQCVTSQVRLVSRDICARPHTFQLLTIRPQEKGDKNTLISRSINTLTTTKHLLSADTKEERILWCNRLNEALTYIRKWDPHALCVPGLSKLET